MRIGIGLSMAANAPRYDAEDLLAGTVSLNFVETYSGPTVRLDFVNSDFRAWNDDPSWPYGFIGVFKGKT
ncbi:hypothetical protein [Cupriavidus sp.]|uniref:hypothetical protein n=1 Tax=Cupriavidus sp. TaxID=1873897 RepID=UPI003D0F0836